MPFGLGNNTAQTLTSGFRPSVANNSWNPFGGAKNSLLNFANQEIPYSQVFSGFINAGQRISTFDFNKTDAQLKRELESHNLVMASALGALTGRSIGSALAVGGGAFAGLTVPKISSTGLAKRLIEAGSERAKEEIIEEVESLLNTTKSLLANRVLIEGYMKLRSFIKKQPLVVLERFFDKETALYIKNKWGNEGEEPLILSEIVEEKIESISNPMVRVFVEEAIDEGYASFIETGYVIATELDSALAEFQMRQSQSEQVLTIQTIADEPESEQLIITGSSPETIQENAEQAIQNWRVLQSRDIGNIVTQNVEVIRANPQSRRLEIVFKSVSVPPFVNPNGSPAHQSILTIPHIKKNIAWDKLKRTLRYRRDIPAYYWGDSTARLWFDNSRKLILKYDAVKNTKQFIKEYLNEIAELSEENIKSITASDVLEQPSRNRDNAIGMYPVEARLITRKLTNQRSGNANSIPQEIYQFPIWTENPRSDYVINFNQSDL
jgi:hypothetical protein